MCKIYSNRHEIGNLFCGALKKKERKEKAVLNVLLMNEIILNS